MKIKNKYGFTLIELLAVIVVLAIIALIATPIVMNTIKNAKKGAAERSAENYIKQVETAIGIERMGGSKLSGRYDINSDGNLIGPDLVDPLVIKMSGDKPTSGIIIIKKGDVILDGTKLVIGDYDVTCSDSKCSAIKSAGKIYENGEVVYFNVTTGEKCTSSEYTETQSNMGVKEGCMKFYAFNDDSEDKVNLILDHNTTPIVLWSSSVSNESGPSEVLTQLKSDTDRWQGTITPSNYTMNQTGQESKANYTIDYSSYKARLITAGEIATITGYTGWNEKLSTSFYFFHTKSTTGYEGAAGTNKYAWLFDNTFECTTNGCNVAYNNPSPGYWTSSSRATDSNSAWCVDHNGRVFSRRVDDSPLMGVRPVIEVLRSKLN